MRGAVGPTDRAASGRNVHHPAFRARQRLALQDAGCHHRRRRARARSESHGNAGAGADRAGNGQTQELTVQIDVAAYRIPTASPESDGTFEWDATTLVAVHLAEGDKTGFGYTYADTATATLIRDVLADIPVDPMNIDAAWGAMIRAVRNLGRRGIAAMAISGVDAALWDLKCKLLGVPLVQLLGRVRDAAPTYGSGGFTSMSIEELQAQLAGWAGDGIPRV